MLRSLVGSEMCIRDSLASPPEFSPTPSLPLLPSSGEAVPLTDQPVTDKQQHIRNLFDDDVSGMKSDEITEPPLSPVPDINPGLDTAETPLVVEGSTQSGPLSWVRINYEEIDMATLLKVRLTCLSHPLIHPLVHPLIRHSMNAAIHTP